jgi:hypothetical protein
MASNSSFPLVFLQVEFDRPSMTLDILIKYGKFLVEEQDNVKRVQLADAYMAGAWKLCFGGKMKRQRYVLRRV